MWGIGIDVFWDERVAAFRKAKRLRGLKKQLKVAERRVRDLEDMRGLEEMSGYHEHLIEEELSEAEAEVDHLKTEIEADTASK